MRSQQHLAFDLSPPRNAPEGLAAEALGCVDTEVKAYANHAAGTEQGPDSVSWHFNRPQLHVQGTQARKAPLWAGSGPPGISVSSCVR